MAPYAVGSKAMISSAGWLYHAALWHMTQPHRMEGKKTMKILLVDDARSLFRPKDVRLRAQNTGR